MGFLQNLLHEITGQHPQAASGGPIIDAFPMKGQHFAPIAQVAKRPMMPIEGQYAQYAGPNHTGGGFSNIAPLPTQNNVYGPQMQGNYGVHLPQQTSVAPTLQNNYPQPVQGNGYGNYGVGSGLPVQQQPWQNIRLQ